MYSFQNINVENNFRGKQTLFCIIALRRQSLRRLEYKTSNGKADALSPRQKENVFFSVHLYMQWNISFCEYMRGQNTCFLVQYYSNNILE